MWADSGYRAAASRLDRDNLQWRAARPSDIAKLPERRKKAAVKKHERGRLKTKFLSLDEHRCTVSTASELKTVTTPTSLINCTCSVEFSVGARIPRSWPRRGQLQASATACLPLMR